MPIPDRQIKKVIHQTGVDKNGIGDLHWATETLEEPEIATYQRKLILKGNRQNKAKQNNQKHENLKLLRYL